MAAFEKDKLALKATLTHECAEYTFFETTLRYIWARDKKLSREVSDKLFKISANNECPTPITTDDQ